MGAIGVGGRGTYDLEAFLREPDVQVVAICDVQRSRRERAGELVERAHGAGCAATRDFREVLGRPDLDAVLLAPGDRWHGVMAILAMRAGKDVFCEKPSTMSVEEGRQLVETAAQYGRIFQTGTQRLSEENFVLADELARCGRLGRLHTVLAHTLPFRIRTDWLPAEPEPPEEECDWNLWLGPAPQRPYNRAYLAGCMVWLDFMDFGTGVAGWGSHTIAQCQAAMGAPAEPALEYRPGPSADGDGFTCRYRNDMRLVLRLGGWRGTCGVRYEGDEGWVSVADGYEAPDVSSPRLLADRAVLLRNYRDRTGRGVHHVRDFLASVRTRRPSVVDAAVAHGSMTTCHCVNAALLFGRPLRWAPTRGGFEGEPEAGRLLHRASREPWIA